MLMKKIYVLLLLSLINLPCSADTYAYNFDFWIFEIMSIPDEEIMEENKLHLGYFDVFGNVPYLIGAFSVLPERGIPANFNYDELYSHFQTWSSQPQIKNYYQSRSDVLCKEKFNREINYTEERIAKINELFDMLDVNCSQMEKEKTNVLGSIMLPNILTERGLVGFERFLKNHGRTKEEVCSKQKFDRSTEDGENDDRLPLYQSVSEILDNYDSLDEKVRLFYERTSVVPERKCELEDLLYTGFNITNDIKGVYIYDKNTCRSSLRKYNEIAYKVEITGKYGVFIELNLFESYCSQN